MTFSKRSRCWGKRSQRWARRAAPAWPGAHGTSFFLFLVLPPPPPTQKKSKLENCPEGCFVRPAVCYLGLKREGRWQGIIPASSWITDHGKVVFEKTGSGGGLGERQPVPVRFPVSLGLITCTVFRQVRKQGVGEEDSLVDIREGAESRNNPSPHFPSKETFLQTGVAKQDRAPPRPPPNLFPERGHVRPDSSAAPASSCSPAANI